MPDFLSLDQVIAHWSSIEGQREAIVSQRNGERISYRELDTLIDQFSARYADKIPEGSHCAILLDDSLVCHALIHTVFRLGATLIPLDSELGYASLTSILQHSDATHIFIGEKNNKLPFVLEKSTLTTHVFQQSLAAYADEMSSAVHFTSPVSPEHTAMIAYTSGTTSAPKGVVLKHRHLLAAYRAATVHLYSPKKAGCVFRIATLGTLGIHFFYPQFSGGTTVLLPTLSVVNANRLFTQYTENTLDFLYLVPSLVKMLNHLGKTDSPLYSGLVVSAGAPLQSAEQDLFQDKFGLTLRNIYGLTESSFAVFYGDQTGDKGTNSIGKALSVQAKIVDAEGRETAQGSVGELVYKGPMVSNEYYKNPGATAATFNEGWLRTGDLVKIDQEGNFSIVGRKKDLVIRGGFNIYPLEIEEVILAYEGVLNAFVFGIENEVKGEELRAVVQVKAGYPFSEDTFFAYVRNAVGAFRAPDRYLVQCEALPLNSAGKFDRQAILTMFNIQHSNL